MNIRNLIRIQDSIDRVIDSSLEEYRETARALNDNFYANLLYRLSAIVDKLLHLRAIKVQILLERLL